MFVKKPHVFNTLRGMLYGKSWAEKWKILKDEGFKEYPIPSISITFGVLLGFYTFYVVFIEENTDKIPKYRERYTIYRPDDPRVQSISHESSLDH